ncbi:glycosyltransferase family 4 protein [Achromobacter spanius]|uniref:Lipopolysaccharides biosynthesis glycosyltransferase n=1 Tax=Achromobacter spanius TaxID=217203 RepID=A0AAW3I690_9BURK|nr:glycosyltransferase family 4 protein [Achromobacter spanius]KNE28288.1 lipopolysaccharides biosynthesis glycosyltransferase [Achromobacter spanius]
MAKQSSEGTPNIWYVHPYAGGPGVGRYSRPYYLARQWLQAGARATVFTPSFHHLLDTPQMAGTRDIAGVAYEFVPARPYQGNGAGRLAHMAAFSLKMRLHVDKYARLHGRPDMIIASSPHPYVFLATHAVARKFGARSVFEVRDLWPLSLTELAGVSPTHPLVRFTGWVERYAHRHADTVVSLLPCTLEHMTATGLAPERWRYIPNGVHTDEVVHTASAEAHPTVKLARQWRETGRSVVVYAGALGRPNHVDSLVQAIARLRDQGDEKVAAIIVGRGELQETLRVTIAERNLGDRVALFEQMPKQAVLTLLAHADIGYISLRPEPLFRFGVSPNKLWDYMLARLPVLFALQAGNDPVHEAQCGVSVDPGEVGAIADGLRALSTLSEPERVAMGERGRTYVLAHHSYEALAQAYLQLEAPGEQ